MAAPLPLGCATRGKCTIKKLIFAKNVYFCSMLQATVGVQPFLLWGSRGPTVGVGARGLWGLAQEAAGLPCRHQKMEIYYFTILLFYFLVGATYHYIGFIILYIIKT